MLQKREADMAKATARHILVDTYEEAEELLREIEGGADFAALAEVHSKCPSGSGSSGGDLGEFGPGQMVPEFDHVVFHDAVGVGDRALDLLLQGRRRVEQEHRAGRQVPQETLHFGLVRAQVNRRGSRPCEGLAASEDGPDSIEQCTLLKRNLGAELLGVVAHVLIRLFGGAFHAQPVRWLAYQPVVRCASCPAIGLGNP